MKALFLAIAVGVVPLAAAQAQDSSAKTTTSPCVVTQKGDGASGLSASASAGGSHTSVTVGGGHASGSTSTGGSAATSTDIGRTRVDVKPGASVTVHSSANGQGSVAVGAVSDGQVMTLSSGNGCVVTIEPRG